MWAYRVFASDLWIGRRSKTPGRSAGRSGGSARQRLAVGLSLRNAGRTRLSVQCATRGPAAESSEDNVIFLELKMPIIESSRRCHIARSHAARLLASWYTVRAARTNASRVFHEKHDGACDLARGAERTGPAASAAGVRRRPGGGGADRGGLPRACWHQRHGRVGLPVHRRRRVRRGELLRRGHGRGGLLGGRAQLPVDQRWR